MPADGAAEKCAEAVAALRAIRRPQGSGTSERLTVQGVISVVDCALSQRINSSPQVFVDSAAAYAKEMMLDGINIDWEACPYYCDQIPIDCGTTGATCKCSPAGFGKGVADTVNALGKTLQQQNNRTVSLAIGVLAKGNDGKISKPPHVYPHISKPGSPHPTSDITRLLKTSPFLDRLTDMDSECKKVSSVQTAVNLKPRAS